MRLQRVNLSQAKLLKKFGYNHYSGASYLNGEFVSYLGWKNSDKPIPIETNPKKPFKGYWVSFAAPLIVEVFKWLRETKGMYVEVHFVPIQGYSFTIWALDVDSESNLFPPEIKETDDEDKIKEREIEAYEKCESAAIDEVLTLLTK